MTLHNNAFPQFADLLTLEWATKEDNPSKVWIVKPNYIKFWNDELYGPEGTKEFQF